MLDQLRQTWLLASTVQLEILTLLKSFILRPSIISVSLSTLPKRPSSAHPAIQPSIHADESTVYCAILHYHVLCAY